MYRQISAPRGFSLIEMLVGLFIVGLLLGITSISLGTLVASQPKAQASIIQRTLEMVSERAIMLNRPHRVVFDKDSFWVEEFVRGKWRRDIPPPFQQRFWQYDFQLENPPVTVEINRLGDHAPARFSLLRGQTQLNIEVALPGLLNWQVGEARF